MADASGESSEPTAGGSGTSEPTSVQPVVTDGFKAIGPDPIGKKKKRYKFVEPPGISTWIFSFAKKCLACGLIYAFGYLRISVGWLVGPIVLMVVRDQWRRHHDAKRAIAQAAAKGDEREIILARLGDNLPSWVIFPDVERAEWLNMIIKQLWPRINHYVYDLVVQSIEPGLRDTLSTSYKMGSFKFEKVILGDTPIRVRGVKVYDERKTDRNEIIMDMEVIYAGDCDVRFSLSKMRAGIKDLQVSYFKYGTFLPLIRKSVMRMSSLWCIFSALWQGHFYVLHGTMRLVMKPLINQMPLIGGVQYFFLNPPSLDFNLIGVADVLDMPGLADLIRRIVQEQIAAMCVLPNKMFIQLAENVNPRETCALRPQGVIRICAVEARNLLKKDVGVLGMGKSDPYVVLQVGAQSFKSKIINNTVTPKWDFNCEALVSVVRSQTLKLEVWDYDSGWPGIMNDDFLGRTSVDLSLVKREGSMDVWLDLEDVKKGQIRLRLNWLTFSENPVDLKTALHQAENHGLASCMLTVHLDSVKNLPVVNRKATGINFGKSSQLPREGAKPDPYAILSVGKTQHESTTMEKTTDPVFEQTLHFLVRNPLTDTLLVKLMDRKTSLELGSMKQPLDLVFGRPGMIMEKQNFTLNTRSEAKVVLDMQLVVLKPWTQGMEDDDFEDELKLPEDPTPAAPTPAAAKPEPAPAQSSVGTIEHVPGTELKRTSSIKQPTTVEDMVVRSEESKPLLSAAPSVDEDKAMKIRLTIRYSQTTHQLIVVVHSVSNLPIEQNELPDPYVKLYVLPERNKKHKTEAQKDQCNPLYDERFEFPLIDLRGKTLEVTVCDKKYLRSSPKIGDVRVALDDYVTGNSVTNWYPLVD